MDSQEANMLKPARNFTKPTVHPSTWTTPVWGLQALANHPQHLHEVPFLPFLLAPIHRFLLYCTYYVWVAFAWSTFSGAATLIRTLDIAARVKGWCKGGALSAGLMDEVESRRMLLQLLEAKLPLQWLSAAYHPMQSSWATQLHGVGFGMDTIWCRQYLPIL